MPNDFDNWIAQLDGEDYIKWAEYFGREMYLKGKTDVFSMALRDNKLKGEKNEK